MYSASQRTAGKICLASDISWQRGEDDDKKSGHMVDKGGVKVVKRVGGWSRAGMWPTRARVGGWSRAGAWSTRERVGGWSARISSYSKIERTHRSQDRQVTHDNLT